MYQQIRCRHQPGDCFIGKSQEFDTILDVETARPSRDRRRGSFVSSQADDEQTRGRKCRERRDGAVEALGLRLPANGEPAPNFGREAERGAATFAGAVAAVLRMPATTLEVGR